MAVEINSDFAEGYGDLKYGDDEGLMPFVHSANVACGYHGGDPSTIARVLDLAKKHGVKVGAHPSLPDRPGFGRREMDISADDYRDHLLYQIGALKAFLDVRDMALTHIKPHGKMYAMSRSKPEFGAALLDVAAFFEVPLIVFAGSEPEKESRRRGMVCLPEFYVDMTYYDDGRFAVRKDRDMDVAHAASQAVGLARDSVIITDSGNRRKVDVAIVALHNDMPNAAAVAKAVREALDAL